MYLCMHVATYVCVCANVVMRVYVWINMHICDCSIERVSVAQLLLNGCWDCVLWQYFTKQLLAERGSEVLGSICTLLTAEGLCWHPSLAVCQGAAPWEHSSHSLESLLFLEQCEDWMNTTKYPSTFLTVMGKSLAPLLGFPYSDGSHYSGALTPGMAYSLES